MARQFDTASLDRLIARLAERQHGVVEHTQLLGLGLSRGAIAHRIATGRLPPVHRGVYAVGHRRLSASGRRMAAVLACGPHAVLSHQTAADLWGIRPSSSPRLHVTVPTTNGRGRPGIVVHRTRSLLPGEVTRRDGIPVTTVARTVLDLGAELDARSLRRTVERADRAGLLDVAAVEEAFVRHPGRATRVLAAAIAAADPAAVRSELESDFLALCREHGIRRPEVNALVAGLEVDFLWRDVALVVEADGWSHHRGRPRFEEDRRRDVHLTLQGLTVVRFTHDAIVHDGASVAASVSALLASRRPTAASRRGGASG